MCHAPSTAAGTSSCGPVVIVSRVEIVFPAGGWLLCVVARQRKLQ